MRHLRWIVGVIVVGVLAPASARAQVPVIDAANLIQTVQIAINTYQAYRTLMEEYELLVKMARRHPAMGRYRTTDVPFVTHGTARYGAAAPLLSALNGGDPTGQGYDAIVRAATRFDAEVSAATPEGRALLRKAYATLDIADSTASLAAHQIGHVRAFSKATAAAITAVERDTLGGGDDLHQQTAILDRMAAAEVIARRQDTATNQVISHLLEHALVNNKRSRDAEAISIGMRLSAARHYRAYSSSFFTAAASDQAHGWRQP